MSVKNFTVYLGSEAGRNFEESIKHLEGRVNETKYENKADYYVQAFLEYKFPFRFLSLLATNSHHFYASYNLVVENDIQAFKYNTYLAAKINILSEYDYQWAYNGRNVGHFFNALMSDSPELLNYFIQHRDEIVDINAPYHSRDARPFFNANTLLALTGEWALLKTRALLFINDPKMLSSNRIRIYEHEFYIGLAEQDIEKMKKALNILLEPKNAKKAVYDCDVCYDFYLQMQVLMYAKIAMIHGFDLGIDSPIAPKALIEINPLEKYEDPYDFMKAFSYDKPHQDWVNLIQQRIAERQAQALLLEKQKENKMISFFKGLFKFAK
ncbi:hypothetical protein A4G19_01215 [Pasteurellaceae bacterium Macca]|nr:hypothetical protein [Pasteurellaceae bacterium Macca]